MKKWIIERFLTMLNSQFLNASPCRYGYIGNVDAFSYEHLASEEKQRPGITIRTILDEADHFRSCPLTKDGLLVLEGDGTTREATPWDYRDLREAFAPPKDKR